MDGTTELSIRSKSVSLTAPIENDGVPQQNAPKQLLTGDQKEEKEVEEGVEKRKNKKKQPKQPKQPTPPKKKQPKAPATPAAPTDPEQMFRLGFLHDVYQERPIGSAGVSQIMTRFPPEPNGYLHIGHSKAIAINFGFAKYHGGKCYLRYDDTNPKGEEERYINSIKELVLWLGFEPYRVTYSSDYFQQLYDLAEELIKRGLAYVCHCTEAEIKAQRGIDTQSGTKGKERFGCIHRDRSVEENLREFRKMQAGEYRAQEACLRMKQDYNNGNPQMWDLTAYRIIENDDGTLATHLRTGDKWKTYPTYDFTHCLCDSFEKITHSLCTTEFEQSRESYDWLINALEVYPPMQREYGRLNMSGTVLSKRKLITLVNGGYVRGWDDPRLYTIVALRRRGIPPGAILSFVSELGVTKANSTIETVRFEKSVRTYLETSVPRLMVITDPIKVIIDDLPDDYLEMVELPYGKDPSFGSHMVPFTKTVFIERSDFRDTPSKDFFRLALGGSVGLLKVPYPITAQSFETDPETGLVTVVRASYDIPPEGEKIKKPKAYIHWLADSPAHNSPLKAEVRIFNQLFKSSNPLGHPEGYLADINPDSEEIYPNALLDTGFNEIKARGPWPKADTKPLLPPGPEATRFQGMRVAYFCEDKDSTSEKIVLNRIVALKEDPNKE
ncbi:hypothetical protein KEM54_001453 [Ascosphaera aggregata]|nr:hypothetical protein KEM54_001453 [Ascosphaera aggregata]